MSPDLRYSVAVGSVEPVPWLRRTLVTKKKLISIVTACLLASTASIAAAEKEASYDGGHQLALAALGKMSDYLRSLDRWHISAVISKDEVLLDGQKLQFDSSLEFTANLPGEMFAEVTTASTKRQYFYDGKQFTLYTPLLKYYASFDAPDTLGKTLMLAEEKFDVELPLLDLFLWGSEYADYSAIEDARVVGIGLVDGVSCNHFAFRQKDVDWQICIKRGDSPLPLKLVINTKTEAEQPQFVARIKWDTAPLIPGTDFSFKPRQDDQRINFGTGGK